MIGIKFQQSERKVRIIRNNYNKMASTSDCESYKDESQAPEMAEAATGSAAGPSVKRKRHSFSIDSAISNTQYVHFTDCDFVQACIY